ncbi:hypothetical protein SEA_THREERNGTARJAY_40 [Mycobacterium phage ThreeRngTarjay]|uniref:hypothetical protein n=1 Tax=Mycobacterium phage Redno2 TaxID=1340709 RepID=UPI000387A669|nr:hypothetical protein N860_gp040 [Mycobacterium phage Redno2]AWH13854.1 hypothetical protein SEA_HALLEY_42 [Mycobacterium phage Halley]AXQ52279.1 hypothetical protein SEA_ERICMILLARD_42 [Mycobacterium phage EricMillard]AXQ62450.1 hypothetical protein SEA_ZELINK_43 [Mycobacterium phage Zelink]AYB69529.1 hypothetical protein SEA_KALAH2_42 [Mycobacterium phage Kalah2]QBI99680.1 hypothetical protein SEA_THREERNGTARJAY_40 [Mycobacterium phage ThreeRngTarjay]QBI99991.1 hypothetical protein SEA_PH
MTLRTDWTDNVGDEVDADFLNQVGVEVNANTAARPGKGAFSALPAAGVAGRLYYATDAGIILRDNGSSWDIVANTEPAVQPPTAGWSTNTLGTATVGADKGGRLFTITSSGGLLTPRIEYRTLSPTSNYIVTARIEPIDYARGEGQSYSGLILRNGTSGNSVLFGYMVYAGQAPYLVATRGNSGNIRASDYAATVTDRFAGYPRWIRLRDNGTNRIFEFSPNGFDWCEFYVSLRTDHITPDQVGWGGAQSTSAARSLVARLRSFEISS